MDIVESMTLFRITVVLGCVLAAVEGAGQMQPRDLEFIHVMQAGVARMDADMAIAPTNGNVDHDFATMMLPHHQGAIDVAKAELRYGRDPEMRQVAEAMLRSHQEEMDATRAWLGQSDRAAWRRAH
jgi:uncharacterized protein (DUF305 family)